MDDPPPVDAIVIVLPDSVTVTFVPPAMVTAVDPDVLDVICESLEPPAATVNDPSLVTLPSTSVPVNVMVLPVSEILMIPATLNVTSVDPDVLDEITDVVPVPAATVNDPSLVTLPSTSVAVIVMLPDVAENDKIPPAVNVTSVPVDEFNVTGDDAPENVKSVDPPPVDAIVIVLPTSVTVTLAPPAITTLDDPDVLDAISESLAPPAATVNDPSLVTLPSTSVPVNVMVLPVSEILMIPATLNVTSVDPDVLDEITDVVPVPAPTLNDPSLVTLPSTSVAVMVMLPDVAENDKIPPAVNVTSVPVDEFNVTGDDAPENVKSDPPPDVAAIVIVLPDSVTVTLAPPAITTLDDPDVLDEISESLAPPAATVNDPSLVKLPSTSVAVIVMLPDVAENDKMPPAVNVTSVPVDEFNVTGDDAPVNVKSAPPPDDAAIVIVLPTSVTVTLAPPAMVTSVDPDVLDDMVDVLAPPAPTVNDPSLVTLPSTSVPVNVIDPPFDDVVSEIVMIPAALTVTPVAPDVLDKITDDDAPPAPTPNVPSLVTLPSTSVPVNVMVDPDVDAETIPAPAMVIDPPPFDNVVVFVATDNVCNSLVAETSTAAIVIVEPDSVTVIPDPPETVTAVDPDVLELMVDELAPPTPTVNNPSLATSPSISVAVMVNVLVPVL